MPKCTQYRIRLLSLNTSSQRPFNEQRQREQVEKVSHDEWKDEEFDCHEETELDDSPVLLDSLRNGFTGRAKTFLAERRNKEQEDRHIKVANADDDDAMKSRVDLGQGIEPAFLHLPIGGGECA